MDIQTFQIVSALLSVITLIVFFVLAANVATIKQKVDDDRLKGAKSDYYINKFLGKNDEAYRSLLYIFMQDMSIAPEPDDDWSSKPKKDPTRTKYEPLFAELGYDYPSGLEYDKL